MAIQKQSPKSVFIQLKKKCLIFRGTGLMAVLIEIEIWKWSFSANRLS